MDGGRVIKLGEMGIVLTGDDTPFAAMLASAQARLVTASATLARLGTLLLKTVVAPLAAVGAWSVKAFADFDQAMVRSTSIMGNVSDAMNRQLGDTARRLAMNTTTTAVQLAGAYEFLGSAGFSAAEALSVLPVVEKFGVAGAMELANATTFLTDAQSALGLRVKDTTQNMVNMQRVSDVLTQANNLANGSVEQFSRALTNKAAGALRQLNKDLEEGVAVLATYADQGLKGEAAGEALTIVLRDLQHANIDSAAAWEKHGMAVYDTAGKMLPLADIIGQLESNFASLTDEQKKMAATELGFQERSFADIQMLLGTSEKIREYEKALRSAGGATDEVANKRLVSFSAQAQILWNKINDLGTTIGQRLAPYLRVLGVFVEWVTGQFRAWTGEVDVTASALGKVGTQTNNLAQMVRSAAPAFATLAIGASTAASIIKIAIGSVLIVLNAAVEGVAVIVGTFAKLMADSADMFGPLVSQDVKDKLRKDQMWWDGFAEDRARTFDTIKESMADSAESVVDFQKRWNAAVNGMEDIANKTGAPVPRASGGNAGPTMTGSTPAVPDAGTHVRANVQSTRDFQQISLRRMSLAGLARSAPKKKQEVTDQGVQNKLDALIDVTKKNGTQPARAG